jgi:hypothetical protein
MFQNFASSVKGLCATLYVDIIKRPFTFSTTRHSLNHLNAELNLICHLLVLLGDLTFTGPCIVSIFQYISKKMQRYTVYLYVETALNVSGRTSTHHQERIQLYIQHLLFFTPLLLSAAIVESWNSVLWVAYATHSTLKPVPTLPR